MSQIVWDDDSIIKNSELNKQFEKKEPRFEDSQSGLGIGLKPFVWSRKYGPIKYESYHVK